MILVPIFLWVSSLACQSSSGLDDIQAATKELPTIIEALKSHRPEDHDWAIIRMNQLEIRLDQPPIWELLGIKSWKEMETFQSEILKGRPTEVHNAIFHIWKRGLRNPDDFAAGNSFEMMGLNIGSVTDGPTRLLAAAFEIQMHGGDFTKRKAAKFIESSELNFKADKINAWKLFIKSNWSSSPEDRQRLIEMLADSNWLPKNQLSKDFKLESDLLDLWAKEKFEPKDIHALIDFIESAKDKIDEFKAAQILSEILERFRALSWSDLRAELLKHPGPLDQKVLEFVSPFAYPSFRSVQGDDFLLLAKASTASRLPHWANFDPTKPGTLSLTSFLVDLDEKLKSAAPIEIQEIEKTIDMLLENYLSLYPTQDLSRDEKIGLALILEDQGPPHPARKKFLDRLEAGNANTWFNEARPHFAETRNDLVFDKLKRETKIQILNQQIEKYPDEVSELLKLGLSRAETRAYLYFEYPELKSLEPDAQFFVNGLKAKDFRGSYEKNRYRLLLYALSEINKSSRLKTFAKEFADEMELKDTHLFDFTYVLSRQNEGREAYLQALARKILSLKKEDIEPYATYNIPMYFEIEEKEMSLESKELSSKILPKARDTDDNRLKYRLLSLALRLNPKNYKAFESMIGLYAYANWHYEIAKSEHAAPEYSEPNWKAIQMEALIARDKAKELEDLIQHDFELNFPNAFLANTVAKGAITGRLLKDFARLAPKSKDDLRQISYDINRSAEDRERAKKALSYFE